MYLTWLDNNSWLIELGGQRILVDPWLVGPLVFGNFPWLFKGEHSTSPAIPDRIDLILLSQGLADHSHPQTLQQLDRQIPVVASVNAAKVASALGYTQVTALAHGDCFTLGDRVTIQALPGAPIGPLLTENSYLLTDQHTQLYYEPHGYHAPELQAVAPVDVVITPIVNLELPLLGPLIRGKESALQVAEWLHPQVMIPTAAGGDVVYTGLLASVLRQQGSIDEFRQQLVDRQLTSRLLTPKPGERIELLFAEAA